ncbi:protein kinase domain-containing protein [Streptomyces fulvoviolaceus]|uniref:protein kinase domain-containing protein n=1 Tax=Streptomyces fulvoviolaceus TaxID=285535 RepID=UPI0021C117F6|nr:protein kinase [Streptomyces fulvoviolaceus]MCT9077189.1 protein kinase [Streptomyces fulvoviolaceus]
MLNPTARRLVLNRRGSTVWDVTTDRGRYALKLGYPVEATAEWEGQEWTARAPAREGAVLLDVGVENVSYGEWEHGTWNVQPWHEGESLYERWKPCRSQASPEPDLGDALACAEALADLHSKGWSHGDVQPAHFILGPNRAALIDLALARGGAIPESYAFPFRGCLVHYEAPEISRRVLITGEAEPTPKADSYALGASLFISATGWRAVAYPDDASRTEQRQAIVSGTHRNVAVPGILGKLIEQMLSYDPDDRPTAAEVYDALRNELGS